MLSILALVASLQPPPTAICPNYAITAGIIMTRRQEGYIKEYMLEQANNLNVAKEFKENLVTIVNMAYDIPIYQHIHEKVDAIDKFGDVVLIKCIEANSKEI
jgi:hypothetical protein